MESHSAGARHTVMSGSARPLACTLTRVDPLVVADVTADTTLQAGRFRHPLRSVRRRPDLHVTDVPPLD